MAKDLEWNDKIYYEVPNVIGKTIKEAKKELMNFQVEIEGEGNIVVEQAPPAHEKIEDQSKVRILVE